MQRAPVESRAIDSIGYENGTLEVKFTNDKIYTYYNFPEEIYISLMKAESIGKYFNQNIKKQYPHN